MGKPATYLGRLSLVRGYEESWGRVIISLQDITRRLAMEQALRQSEQRLKWAQEMARIGDWEYDLTR
jgi:two-component system, sensor histidine kinase